MVSDAHIAPDFLVIGAQKSATTWLWKSLRQHPGLYLPPKKELHYFDRSFEYPSPSLLAEPSPIRRYSMNSLYQTYCFIRKKSKNNNDLLWWLHYFFGYCNDQWYCSLFKGKLSDQLSGEVTPSYSILKIKDIEKVFQLNPEFRVILLLRNPIERAWSAFLMNVRTKKRSSVSITKSEIMRYLESENCYLKGDYATIFQNWTSVFPLEQIHIEYYQDIRKRPQEVLDKIVTHIGAPAHKWDQTLISQEYNKGLEYKIPPHYYNQEYKRYYKSMKTLFDLLGHQQIKQWIEPGD